MERKVYRFGFRGGSKRPSDLGMPIYQSRRTTRPKEKLLCEKRRDKGKSSKLKLTIGRQNVELLIMGKGLYANIHAKRKRIKAGSGEDAKSWK